MPKTPKAIIQRDWKRLLDDEPMEDQSIMRIASTIDTDMCDLSTNESIMLKYQDY